LSEHFPSVSLRTPGQNPGSPKQDLEDHTAQDAARARSFCVRWAPILKTSLDFAQTNVRISGGCRPGLERGYLPPDAQSRGAAGRAIKQDDNAQNIALMAAPQTRLLAVPGPGAAPFGLRLLWLRRLMCAARSRTRRALEWDPARCGAGAERRGLNHLGVSVP